MAITQTSAGLIDRLIEQDTAEEWVDAIAYYWGRPGAEDIAKRCAERYRRAYVKGVYKGYVKRFAQMDLPGWANANAEDAQTLLRVLAIRRFTVSDNVRERIESNADLDQFHSWLDLAVTVDGVQEIFAD